jgi:hypothetical protein
MGWRTIGRSLGAGAAGACALTLLHESLRRVWDQAPRMDVLGMEAIRRFAGDDVIPEPRLHRAALFGDVVANSVYYSLVGAGRSRTWMRGVLLGVGAGLGAAFLPPVLGLSREASRRTAATTAATVALYLAGGLSAAAMAELTRGAG